MNSRGGMSASTRANVELQWVEARLINEEEKKDGESIMDVEDDESGGFDGKHGHTSYTKEQVDEILYSVKKQRKTFSRRQLFAQLRAKEGEIQGGFKGGAASAAEWDRLVASDAAGTLSDADQMKFRLWHEARRSGGDNDADLLDAKKGFETADGPEEKQIAAEKLANAVAYCETRHELRSKSMIETKKVSRELAAKTREKTNLKTLT
jgi:hypothetical protein